MELLILTIIFLILNILCLRKYAKEEMFNGYGMLLLFSVVSIIPVINIIAFICFVVILLINRYDSVDDFAKALFLIKDKTKKDDIDNFKGKGYR